MEYHTIVSNFCERRIYPYQPEYYNAITALFISLIGLKGIKKHKTHYIITLIYWSIFTNGIYSFLYHWYGWHIFRILDEIEDYNEPNEDLQDVQLTMSSEEYNSIIGVRRAGRADTQECCVICCDDIKYKSTISETSCGHVYHSKCLRKWITKECRIPTCPTCRADLRVD